MKEKKLRIEDALNATKAAVEEGIVAGGGTIYVNVIPAVTALLNSTEGDERVGVQLVAKALEAPIRQIAANAGIDAPWYWRRCAPPVRTATASTPIRRSTAI